MSEMTKVPFGGGPSSYSSSAESFGWNLMTPTSSGDDDQWGFDMIDDPGTSYRCTSESCMRIFQRDMRIMMKAVTEYDFPAGVWKLLVMDPEGMSFEGVADAHQLREATDAGMAKFANAARKKLAGLATVQTRVMTPPLGGASKDLKDLMDKTWGCYPMFDGQLHVSFETLRHQINRCNIDTTMSTRQKSIVIITTACRGWQMAMADFDLLCKVADNMWPFDMGFSTDIGGFSVSEVVEKVFEACLHFSGMTRGNDLCAGKPVDIEKSDAELAMAMMTFATFMEPIVLRDQRYSIPNAVESLEKIIDLVKSRFPERLPKVMRDMMNLAPELEAVHDEWEPTVGELMKKLELWLIRTESRRLD